MTADLRSLEQFFIVGCPRSGTTMLQQALNRHPRIVIPPETKFFFFLLGRCLPMQRLQVRQINNDLGIDLPLPRGRIRSFRQARLLYDNMVTQYLTGVARPGVTHFGDKSPEHLRRLRSIWHVFPKAKIILLYRDGRDVAASLARMPWMHPDIYVCFAVWLYYAWLQHRLLRARLPNVLFVRYEDLVVCPEQGLRAVLTFLDLPYVPQVADGAGNVQGVPSWEHPWKWRALEKITASRVGASKRELSADQLGVLERWGGRTLRALGYELCTPRDAAFPALFFPRLAWRLLLWRGRTIMNAIRNCLSGAF